MNSHQCQVTNQILQLGFGTLLETTESFIYLGYFHYYSHVDQDLESWPRKIDTTTRWYLYHVDEETKMSNI